MKTLFITVLLQDSHHSPPGKHLSFYQGDIRLTKKQAENLKKYGDPTKGSADSRAASSVDKERWPNAIIPYTFDCSVGKLIGPLRIELQSRTNRNRLNIT